MELAALVTELKSAMKSLYGRLQQEIQLPAENNIAEYAGVTRRRQNPQGNAWVVRRCAVGAGVVPANEAAFGRSLGNRPARPQWCGRRESGVQRGVRRVRARRRTRVWCVVAGVGSLRVSVVFMECVRGA